MIQIYNEDCMKTMTRIEPNSIDIILTSPFYNTNKKAKGGRTLINTNVKTGQYNYVRYDIHTDEMTNEQYCDYTVDLFNSFDNVLAHNGVILYNISYGAENTECMFRAVSGVVERTDFTIADVISWKKKSALPNSCSPNRLTRICEFVFVFCRRDEISTFYMNKNVTSTRETGQKMYENIFNFIEARNNDGGCPYNKATYSIELCEKLLQIYAHEESRIYDPFLGSGTTAVACLEMGLDCIGSEISTNQVKFAKERIELKNPLLAQINGGVFVSYSHTLEDES